VRACVRACVRAYMLVLVLVPVLVLELVLELVRVRVLVLTCACEQHACVKCINISTSWHTKTSEHATLPIPPATQ
jgi:hypothetical protein